MRLVELCTIEVDKIHLSHIQVVRSLQLYQFYREKCHCIYNSTKLVFLFYLQLKTFEKNVPAVMHLYEKCTFEKYFQTFIKNMYPSKSLRVFKYITD